MSEQKTKGAIIRSRARWYEHGERNSKYFVNLEKRAYERKHIVKLKTKENTYLDEPNHSARLNMFLFSCAYAYAYVACVMLIAQV